MAHFAPYRQPELDSIFQRLSGLIKLCRSGLFWQVSSGKTELAELQQLTAVKPRSLLSQSRVSLCTSCLLCKKPKVSQGLFLKVLL